ncbi:MAG: Hsp20/alpha crystallin family protein [Flavipsychrobacter sp.]|jgi:HSP20 family protein|nr:Hsp20/alpha crystallin family protein [Flavipsychrobacter sp.]
MANKPMVQKESTPSIFEDFFKPWNEWFDSGHIWNRTMKVPAVNITDNKENYLISLAIPGMEKKDFNIDIEGNMLTVSCEKEETKEEKDKSYSRKEYNYNSFSRSFNLPEEVMMEQINAVYDNGILNITLPKQLLPKKTGNGKHIEVK